jgi:hypothetical protein
MLVNGIEKLLLVPELRRLRNAKCIVGTAQFIDKFSALVRRLLERPSKLRFKALSSCDFVRCEACSIR